MFVGVLARVPPDAVPSAPADLIEQTGLFAKLPRVEEDFKVLRFNSSQSEVNVGHLPLSSSALFFQTESSDEPGAHWPVSLLDPFVSVSTMLRLQRHTTRPDF